MRAFAWKRAILLFVAVAAIAVAIGSFCIGSPRYYSDKYSASPVAYAPLEYPGTFAPEKQVEPHTCGFHAISSVYRAYGLDPGTNRLRFRLGTDKQATNFDPESLGTLHPDMLRVLGQDGFDARVVLQPKSPESLHRLVSHIQSGHPAVALVRAPGLHWIVLAPLRDVSLEGQSETEPLTLIMDSLQAEAAMEPLRAFVSDRVLSAVLIQPKAR